MHIYIHILSQLAFLKMLPSKITLTLCQHCTSKEKTKPKDRKVGHKERRARKQAEDNFSKKPEGGEDSWLFCHREQPACGLEGSHYPPEHRTALFCHCLSTGCRAKASHHFLLTVQGLKEDQTVVSVMLLEGGAKFGPNKVPELWPDQIFAGSDNFLPEKFQYARVNSDTEYF